VKASSATTVPSYRLRRKSSSVITSMSLVHCQRYLGSLPEQLCQMGSQRPTMDDLGVVGGAQLGDNPQPVTPRALETRIRSAAVEGACESSYFVGRWGSGG
jgi:hypothetical protein